MLAALWALACSPGLAQSPNSIREFPRATLEQLGLDLYRQDSIVAAASDILLARDLDLTELGVQGYITTEDDRGPLVTFVGLNADEFVAVADIRPALAAPESFALVRDRPLNATEMTLFLARYTVLRGISDACPSPYNTAILPDPEDDGWLVYLLVAETQSGVVPVAGHYRVSVNADGTAIRQVDKLFSACLSIDTTSAPDAAAGNAVALVASQTVGELPVETQVYVNLLFGRDLLITTTRNDQSWLIREGAITPFDVAGDD